MALDDETRKGIIEAIQAGMKASGGGGGGSGGGFNMGKLGARAGDLFEGALKGFGNVLDKGGGRVGDSLKGVSTKAAALVGYIEDTNGAFQSLSKVGLGFNADLGSLRMGAAKTRMPLDQFAGLIAKNSNELAGFGTGVNKGAKRFAQLSNSMFESGLIENMLNLGYTVEESNEFLLENMNIDRRRARLLGLSNQQQVESAVRLATTMDVMAKLTGKSAKEQQDQLKDRMREGATQAKIRLLEMDGVKGASESYKQAQASLAGSPKVVGDLMADLVQTGVPMTEATKNFAATNKEAYALLQQAAQATKQGDTAAAEKYAKDAAAATASFANSRQGLTIATLAQVSDIAQSQADRLQEMGPIIDAMAENNKKIGAGLGTTADYISTFNTMLKELTQGSTLQQGGALPNQEAQQTIMKGQLQLADTASKANEAIGAVMKDSKLANDTLALVAKKVNEVAQTFATAVKTMATAAGAYKTDALIENVPMTEQNEKDLKKYQDPLATLADKLDALSRLKDIIGENGLRTEDINLKQALEIEKGLKDVKIGGDDDGDKGTSIFDKITGIFKAEGGPVTASSPYIVGEEGPELLVPRVDGDIFSTGDSRNIMMAQEAIGSDIESSMQSFLGALNLAGQQQVQSLGNLDLSTNFAKTTPDVSSITPNMKQTMNKAMDMAKNMQDNMSDNATNAQNIAKAGAGQMENAGSVEEKLDILNQTMLQLVGINNMQTQIGNKQIKTMRSTGNLMQGIGRA